MITLQTNDTLPDDGGRKLINVEPNSGVFELYKAKPNGTYGSTPYKIVDSTSPESDKIFYIPTPKGLGWTVILSNGAEAEFARY